MNRQIMKVYQCIRAYDPYLPAFEKKYRINENNFSFSELRRLLIKDGFAGTYILKPAFEENNDAVFFTFWNYKILQYKWAEENGLKSQNLDEIRLAQIEAVKPDVYYNFSTYYDNNTLLEGITNTNMIKVCWDATINSFIPPLHEKYDIRLSLFEPYVKYWNQHGYKSFVLPPAFPDSWEGLTREQKDIDILFYGQIIDHFFSDRNKILEELINWNKKKGYNLKVHVQIPKQKKPLLNVRGLRRFANWMPAASRSIREKALPPIYGQELYETISKSKIVINAFGNFNGSFKENMRNYETTGCGAVLISEDGIYPNHFIPGNDFFTYKNTPELFDKIEHVLSLPDQGFELGQNTRNKLKKIYSKQEQWDLFVNFVNTR